LSLFSIWDKDCKEKKPLNQVHCSGCERHDAIVDQTITLPSLANIVGGKQLSYGAPNIGQECSCLGTGLRNISWAVQLPFQYGIKYILIKSLTAVKALGKGWVASTREISYHADS
jgi:hypothetical protein